MHKWYYCEQCGCPSVLCGQCDNNMCNGSEECDSCKDAYDIFKKRKGCPNEFLIREKVEFEIFSIQNIQDLKEKLCLPITMIEVNAILSQIKHLED